MPKLTQGQRKRNAERRRVATAEGIADTAVSATTVTAADLHYCFNNCRISHKNRHRLDGQARIDRFNDLQGRKASMGALLNADLSRAVKRLGL